MHEKIFEDIIYITLHGDEIEPYREKNLKFIAKFN